jgi:dihydropteroate synthase
VSLQRGEPQPAPQGSKTSATARLWRLPDRDLWLPDRPLVMGIVNVTPDSFADGGRFAQPAAALEHALALAAEGADLLDIGGESTRPGATPVPLEEERARVCPVIAALARQTRLPLSVDTYKAAVAQECLDLGAHIINDVTALRGDAHMPAIAARARAGVILVHMQGTPQTMQQAPHYDDVVGEITAFFAERLEALQKADLEPERLVLDPGVGFGKTLEHNLELLARLEAFQELGRPLCLGASRKAFLGKLLGDRPVGERLAASLAVAAYAASTGAVQILRVHDVRATRDLLDILAALAQARRRWAAPPAGPAAGEGS